MDAPLNDRALMRNPLAGREALARARPAIVAAAVVAVLASLVAVAVGSARPEAAALMLAPPVLWWVRERGRHSSTPAVDVCALVTVGVCALLSGATVTLIPAATACLLVAALWCTGREASTQGALLGLLAGLALLVGLLAGGELRGGPLGNLLRAPATTATLASIVVLPVLGLGMGRLIGTLASVGRAVGLEQTLSSIATRLVEVGDDEGIIEATLDGALELLPDGARTSAVLLSPAGDCVAQARGAEIPTDVARWESVPPEVQQALDDRHEVLVTGQQAGGLAARVGYSGEVHSVLVVGARKEDDVHGVLVTTSDQPLEPERQYALAALGDMSGIALAETSCSANLHLSQTRFSALVRDSADALAIVTRSGAIRFASAASRDLVGTDPQELLETQLTRHVMDDDVPAVEAFLAAAAQSSEEPVTVEVRLPALDGGEIRHAELRGRRLEHDCGLGCPLHEEGGETEVAVNLRDVSERVALQAQLTHRALHDDLVGLPNRVLFQDRTGHALRGAARSGRRIGLLFLDLDDFKTVNDSLGHGAGDELLCGVAGRLAGAVRPGDTAARLGGDEFGILLDDLDALDVDAEREALHVAERVLAALGPPVQVGEYQLRPRASVGVVVSDTKATPRNLLRQADVAMYVAKSHGGDEAVLYRHDEHNANLRRLQRVGELRHALERGEIVPWFQPSIDLATGQIIGYEALARWDHPTRGTLSPADFLELAEETGLVLQLGERMLQLACETIARWRERPGGAGTWVAVNLSPTQVAQPSLPALVAATVAAAGIPASALVLEVTESVLMADLDFAASRLAELKATGVRISVDDFGTGYSSLAYLQQLPVDDLKIDQRFVRALDGEPGPSALVQAIVDLGHALELRIVAEGVETAHHLRVVTELGCDAAQGHHLGRPAPGTAVPPSEVVLA